MIWQPGSSVAIPFLEKAIVLGFKDFKWLETEPDLTNIRKKKGYKTLLPFGKIHELASQNSSD